MKKVLILLLLIFSVPAMAQRGHTGEFNVLDYGAVSGDDAEDQTAIQACIDAAAATGELITAGIYEGRTVIIPAGYYNITDSVELRIGVNIQCMPGAMFYFDTGYDGVMWNSENDLYDAWVTGGTYIAEDKLHTIIDLRSPTDAITRNRFKDLTIINAKIGINIEASSTGWVNSNVFEDITLWDVTQGIRTRNTTGNVSHLAANLFSNITIQAYASSTYGIDGLAGKQNMFINMKVWDLPASAIGADLSSGSQESILIGSFGNDTSYISDAGTNNFILNNGKIINKPIAEQSEAGASFSGVNRGSKDNSIGLMGWSYATGGSGDYKGVYGLASGTNSGYNIGVSAYAGNATNNIGIWAEADDWAGRFVGPIWVSTFIKLTPTADPPAGPESGWIYADTDNHLYYYNGSTWIQLDN